MNDENLPPQNAPKNGNKAQKGLKEREEIVRKERAHTQKLRELRLAKEAEEKGKA